MKIVNKLYHKVGAYGFLDIDLSFLNQNIEQKIKTKMKHFHSQILKLLHHTTLIPTIQSKTKPHPKPHPKPKTLLQTHIKNKWKPKNSPVARTSSSSYPTVIAKKTSNSPQVTKKSPKHKNEISKSDTTNGTKRAKSHSTQSHTRYLSPKSLCRPPLSRQARQIQSTEKFYKSLHQSKATQPSKQSKRSRRLHLQLQTPASLWLAVQTLTYPQPSLANKPITKKKPTKKNSSPSQKLKNLNLRP